MFWKYCRSVDSADENPSDCCTTAMVLQYWRGENSIAREKEAFKMLFVSLGYVWYKNIAGMFRSNVEGMIKTLFFLLSGGVIQCLKAMAVSSCFPSCPPPLSLAFPLENQLWLLNGNLQSCGCTGSPVVRHTFAWLPCCNVVWGVSDCCLESYP